MLLPTEQTLLEEKAHIKKRKREVLEPDTGSLLLERS
jgi:hypothetical protein